MPLIDAYIKILSKNNFQTVETYESIFEIVYYMSTANGVKYKNKLLIKFSHTDKNTSMKFRETQSFVE